jgi:hypothetical protein
MLIVFLINAMCSIFGMGIYTAVSNFSTEYLGAYLSGQGMATVFTSFLQIFALAIGVSTETSALVYFWVAIVIVAFTLFLMTVVVLRNPFFQYNEQNGEKRKEKRLSFREIVDILKVIWPSAGIMIFLVATLNTVHPAISSLVVSEGEGNGRWNGGTISSKIQQNKSSLLSFADVYFVPVITFTLNAVLDYVGRFVALKLTLVQVLHLVLSIFST